MNKSVYILAFIFLTAGGWIKAQTTTAGTPAASYGMIENKLKKSDASLSDAEKTSKPKFWIHRAEILMDAFEVNRKQLGLGTQKLTVTLMFQEPKETKTWEEKGSKYEQCIYERVNVIFKDGIVDSYEESKPLYQDPMPEALKALEKAQELDVENKSKKDIKEDYTRLKKDFETLAIELFIKKEFEASFNSFASIATINDKPVMEGVIDTIALYNAGLAAFNGKKIEDAIKYFELARKYNHPEPNLYVFLEQGYMITGDTATGIAVLKEGFKRFPDSQPVQIELINYYLNKGEADKALNYLKVAQQNDPKNMSFIFAEGTLYDKMGETEKAVETYKRCIEIDPNYYDAYYNIGVVYYNKAVKLYEEANSITDQKQYEAAKEVADNELAKSVPYMEKAHEINPTEQTTMQTLKTLYYRLQMTDKYNAIVKEIQGQ
jgi:tetratricopeptide (TPR) repeat protein